MSELAFPLATFHFAVRLDPDPCGGDVMFQEVSGIGTELEFAAVPEGGGNRFVHALPKGVKHPRLALKRGVAGIDSGLVKWCQQVLEGGLAQPVNAKQIEVHLLDSAGKALRSWRFTGAYPVKWSMDPFSSKKQAVVLEVVEFAYSTMERVA